MDRQPDDELTAALAAVHAYLDAERQAAPEETPPDRQGWHYSERLNRQGLRPRRARVAPHWNTIERLRHSLGGYYGIVGL